MDIRSQFAGRYKKDLSVDNLRTKVARRKSITQKENRHKEFRRSRGLSLVDANISVVKEQNLTVLEEVNESCHVTGHENKPADTTKTKAQVKNERHAMLQRFKEDKQLRKLKAQREKASKGVFKCGIYKAETSFIPVFAPLNAAKVKQKEKPAAPIVTRVTRSAAKTEPPLPKTRTQPVPVAVLNSKVSADRAIPRGRGQNSTVKKNEKENKVSTIPPARSTRATAAIASKLPTAVKGPLKSTAAAAKPHKKIVKEVKQQEMVIDKTEPPVIDQSNNKELEQEVAIKDTAVESETFAETSVLVQERKPSFAPQNFVFQPLDGLSSFKFQPMTPKRANAFLTPTFTWSPVEGKRNFVVTRGHHTQENDIDQVSPTEPSLKATIVKLDMDLITSPQIAECTSHASSPVPAGATVIPPSCEASTEKCNQSAQPEESQHDVPFFRGMLKSEIQSLSLMCRDWDQRIDMAIPEDAKDLIRTTVGQTRLLITERFKQFEGLVDNCEFKRGEKETMCTDLDGFWDMIYFQIEDVSKKFVNLRKLEENSWQQTTIQAKKVVRKKSAPTVTVKQNLGDNGRAAAKNRLAAIKAALKNNSKTEESVSEISTPGLPMQVDPVVFDAGFFRIESPAKLPGSLRKKPSSSQTSNTLKSTTKVLQNSEIPVTKGVEEAVEDSQAQKSPSPVNSPVRKVLFAGAVEESLQNQETDPVVTYPDGTESDTVPQVVDLTQYLVPDETIRVGQAESPGLMECLGLESSLNTTDDYYKEANVENTSVMVDDVFMCSPEKVVHRTKSKSPLVDRPGLVPDEEVQTSDNPLDFLGSCTPIMVEK